MRKKESSSPPPGSVDKNSAKEPRPIGTKIIDDVFTDAVAALKPRFEANYEAYMERLWEANPRIKVLLHEAPELEKAREALYQYLDEAERRVFEVDNDLHVLEKATVRECVRAFKSIIGPINEFRTETSALDILWRLSRGGSEELGQKVSVGFLMEFINLFRGVDGKSNIYRESGQVKKGVPGFFRLQGEAAAEARTEILDALGSTLHKHFARYPSGLDEEVIGWRRENRSRILRYFNATVKNWTSYTWQLKHLIKDVKPLLDLIVLTREEKNAIEKAVRNNIPFGITPYYLSLMDPKSSGGFDHAIRAQVIPSAEYVDAMVKHRSDRSEVFDFMGEHDTSPVGLVTRRYPGIAIIKPFNTCAQICVYCQRNWEIDRVLDPNALAPRESLDRALSWFDAHPGIGDVLITGGDPMVMRHDQLRYLLEALAKKRHIYRIRIGTRTPVVLPMRWSNGIVKLLSEFHEPGRREIAIVTHFEHSYEITPEAMEAVQRIRKAGISVYNQAVFTIENSRRFELAKLRRDLRLIGVDPYYTFNMKGKEETRRYMVPIARILQERKEEARLLPGLDRTDEPVFNVPKLGKNHLRAWQDRRLVMIRPDGSRVYEFHPWEKNIAPAPPYNYTDVPIYEYLEELAARGENLRDYRTIWFYF